MSERAVTMRLQKVDQLHALSVELLKAGFEHYKKLKAEGKATARDLRRFTRYLVRDLDV